MIRTSHVLESDQRPLVPIREVFAHVGCSAGHGYELVRRDKFPLPVLRVGQRLRVRRVDLLRYLGLDEGARSS